MDVLYAPWRGDYVRAEKVKGCIFCRESLRSDQYLLLEGRTAYVMMNRYPYSCGHLMVIPYRHISQLQSLSSEERQEMFHLVDKSISILEIVMKPAGFNLGMNLGKTAGAGVDDHIHAHIVPRWNGDTNFMTVTGETRVISEDLLLTRDKLLPYFSRASQEEA